MKEDKLVKVGKGAFFLMCILSIGVVAYVIWLMI